MRRTRACIVMLGAAAALHGCGSAEVAPERLSISARAAAREARTAAIGWTETAELSYIEGEGVRPSGTVFPGAGQWRFVYDAPDRADQLAVTVQPRALEQVTRPPQGPAGYVLGEARLGDEWIDSPEALQAVVDAEGPDVLRAEGTAISMALLPLDPPQWVIRATTDAGSRQWSVDARTGAVLP